MSPPDPYDYWSRCPCCEDYWCSIHQQHAHDCPCPPVEDWSAFDVTPADLAE